MVVGYTGYTDKVKNAPSNELWMDKGTKDGGKKERREEGKKGRGGDWEGKALVPCLGSNKEYLAPQILSVKSVSFGS